MENKKFQYKVIEHGASSRKYSSSIEWLYDAGIINKCYNVSALDTPLEGFKKDGEFKIYMKDTGLLISMLEDDTPKEIINGNLGIYKGAIYENIIADILNKSGKKLYYFNHNNNLEIDFIIKYNGNITPIEVKSSNNTKSKSLTSLINNYNIKSAIRLSSKNIGESNNNIITTLPLYMSIFL